MEKIWKKVSQNEYQKCFEILNTESLIEKETYKKFAIALFEIAKNQLGCMDCKLKFVDNLGNNLGVASAMNKTITLSLSKMDKNTLFKTVSTIYHELTHIMQEKTSFKKKVGICLPAKFPFIHCSGNEKFLPASMLGINPFFFYYTCQHEKQARDIGSECAMELFVELKNIAQKQPTKNGTIRLIERCINQVQMRWDKENENNAFATAQIQEFIKQNPNFIHDVFEKIKQEFIFDASKCFNSNERIEIESRFNCRVGALVLLGCDDNLKSKVLSFVATNFISKGEIFNTMISVIDSPYSKITQQDLTLLFNFATINNFPKDIMLNYLTNWDKKYVIEVVNNRSTQDNTSEEKFL